MKLFAILVLALMFLGNATASAVPDPHACCGADECEMIQCVAMGCLPVPSPGATTGRLPFQFGTPSMGSIDYPVISLPDTFDEVWTPPD